jgi:hypothetical protein
MRIRQLVLSVLVLIATLNPTAYAIQPAVEAAGTCTMPSIPGKGATKADWSTYSLLVRDYNVCLSEKASKYSQRTKDVLEGVGNKVIDWKDTATGWFEK